MSSKSGAVAGTLWGAFRSFLVRPDSCPLMTPLLHRSFSSGGSGARAAPSHPLDVSDFPPELIRNFSIIAHVDHGKSTLSDRILELTGAIQPGHSGQYLDKLEVERERGITVKAQTASTVWEYRGRRYLLNLIDTPGHVDFQYEVSRSLSACSGAVLLTDAAQGVQAQTVANFFLAFELGLSIVPALNKVDLPHADVERCKKQLQATFDIDPQSVLSCSAKQGLGVPALLDAIIERVPPPASDPDRPLRLLLFDAFHDDYRGVISVVKVCDGEVKRGDRLVSLGTGAAHEALEVGVMSPEATPTTSLRAGQVGYLITGMRSAALAQIGDTWHRHGTPVDPIPGFRPIKAVVFAGLYPPSQESFEALREALGRLTLNDASVTVQRETSAALGGGFRCGFLGVLHMEVFQQRLKEEFGQEVIVTAPTVSYILEMPDDEVREVNNACDFPVGEKITRVLEPIVLASIITPTGSVGRVMELCNSRRGIIQDNVTLAGERTLLKYELPLQELASDFFSSLKGLTSGYATLDYEAAGTRQADLCRMDVLLNDKPVDALASVVHRPDAAAEGRRLCQRLKDVLDRQQFEVVIQASLNGSKIVARESIKPYRRDVTAKCYGGDITRKRKLLERQKEGKKRLKMIGRIEVPHEAFQVILRKDK